MSKKIVAYVGTDEVLITLKKNEKEMKSDYFDRDWEADYDRIETDDLNFTIRVTLGVEATAE